MAALVSMGDPHIIWALWGPSKWCRGLESQQDEHGKGCCARASLSLFLGRSDRSQHERWGLQHSPFQQHQPGHAGGAAQPHGDQRRAAAHRRLPGVSGVPAPLCRRTGKPHFTAELTPRVCIAPRSTRQFIPARKRLPAVSCSGPPSSSRHAVGTCSFRRWDPKDLFSFTLQAPGTSGTRTRFGTVPTSVPPADQKPTLQLGRMWDFEGQKGAWGGLGLQMYLE